MKIVSGIFKFFAVILAIIVVFALPAALLAQSAGRLLFSPSKIMALLDENILNSDVMASLAEYSLEQTNATEIADTPYMELAITGMKELNHDEWVDIFDLIAPPELISDTMQEVVRGYYNWVQGSDAVPEIMVDTRDWKETLGKNFIPVADSIMSKLPACTSAQLKNYSQVLEAGDDIPICKPPEPYYSDYLNIAAQAVPDELAKMDDEVNLLRNAQRDQKEWSNLKESLLTGRVVSQFAWIAVLFIYVMIIPLGARSFSGVLKWAAWPIFFAGGFLLVIALAFFAPTRAAGRVIGAADANVPPVLIEPMHNFFVGIFEYLARPIILQALAMLFVSVLGIGVAMFIDYRHRQASKGSTVTRQDTVQFADQPTIIEPVEAGGSTTEEKQDPPSTLLSEEDDGDGSPDVEAASVEEESAKVDDESLAAGGEDDGKEDDSQPSGMFG